MNNFEQRIARALHEQAEADVPAVDLWSGIHAQLTAAQPRRRSWLALPTTRIGRFSFALALLLMLSGAAWTLPEFFNVLDDGLRQAAQAGLTERIKQSQTINGVTVTLHEAYADEERIMVQATIKAADGTSYYLDTLSEEDKSGLSGRDGTSIDIDRNRMPFRHFYPVNQSGQEDDNEQGVLLKFSPRSIVSSNGKLNLRLILYADSSWSEPNVKRQRVGPFVFDFSVPFNAGRTIEINQPQQAAGVTMTLKRINVLPSAMKAMLCFDQPTPGQIWYPSSTLFVDGLENSSSSEILTGADDGCFQQTFELSVANASGWILRVDSLSRGGGETAEKFWTDPEVIVGPWEFHYPEPQPAPKSVVKRGSLITNFFGYEHGLNSLMFTIMQRDGGLMYELSCIEAGPYIGYRLELFDQPVAVLDPGPSGPVQQCVEGKVIAAGGPIMPPGPFPLQFKVGMMVQDPSGGLDSFENFIWDADDKLYYDEK